MLPKIWLKQGPPVYVIISTKTFFMVCFMHFMHTSACPVLWWLYDDDNLMEYSGAYRIPRTLK